MSASVLYHKKLFRTYYPVFTRFISILSEHIQLFPKIRSISYVSIVQDLPGVGQEGLSTSMKPNTNQRHHTIPPSNRIFNVFHNFISKLCNIHCRALFPNTPGLKFINSRKNKCLVLYIFQKLRRNFPNRRNSEKFHISGHIDVSNMDMGTCVQCSMVSQIQNSCESVDYRRMYYDAGLRPFLRISLCATHGTFNTA